jgi:hypothetical protein
MVEKSHMRCFSCSSKPSNAFFLDIFRRTESKHSGDKIRLCNQGYKVTYDSFIHENFALQALRYVYLQASYAGQELARSRGMHEHGGGATASY